MKKVTKIPTKFMRDHEKLQFCKEYTIQIGRKQAEHRPGRFEREESSR